MCVPGGGEEGQGGRGCREEEGLCGQEHEEGAPTQPSLHAYVISVDREWDEHLLRGHIKKEVSRQFLVRQLFSQEQSSLPILMTLQHVWLHHCAGNSTGISRFLSLTTFS